jgi:TPR repeat protein
MLGFSTPPLPEALKRAAELLARACDGNVAEACTELGFRYSRGIGVAVDQEKSAPVDSTRAMAAFAKACSLGSGASPKRIGSALMG